MKQKFVIDGQLFQTPAWHRGMGKYSLELLAPLFEIAKNSDWHDADILLSSNIKTDKEVHEFISKKLPLANIVYLDLQPDEIGNTSVPVHNKAEVDAYVNELQNQGVKVTFLILSLMQGGIHPVFPTLANVQKMVIFYDLIPLMFYDIYLRNPITRDEYIPRIEELLRADTYLAISKTVANDLALSLGVDKSRIVSIDGGAIRHSDAPETLEVPGPFILMPTGNDLRKNNQRAILGFEEFNKRNNNAYSLLITSYFKPHEIEQLSSLSSNVIFTGNISGGQLQFLYENATTLLFPPEYEGLGMPILEAIEQNKTIACSNISVFREMSTKAFYYFDPYSTVEISEALDRAVRGDVDHAEYRRVLSKYTWSRSAKKLFSSIKVSNTDAKQKKSVTVIGPNPTSDSVAGIVMQQSHAELSRKFEVSYAIDLHHVEEHRINYLPYITDTKTLGVGTDIIQETSGDIIYHIDNTVESALPLFYALGGKPGIVILYSDSLDAAWQGMVDGNLIDVSRSTLETEIEQQYSVEGIRYLVSLVARKHTIVVHTSDLRRKIEALLKAIKTSTPVHNIGLPVPGLVYNDVVQEKKQDIIDDTQLFTQTTTPTDFRLDAEIAKNKAIKYSHPSTYDILKVMRFGIIPVSSDTKTDFGIAPKFIISEARYKLIVDDSSAYDKFSHQLVEYTQKNHSEMQYIDNLVPILEGNREE